MCVCIFSGEKDKPFVETGIDPYCNNIIGEKDDLDFVGKNTKGKVISLWTNLYLPR